MSDPFHQVVSVFMKLRRRYSSGEINRLMKEFGATLHYDVYSFERREKGPIWQSESYIDLVLFCDGKEVDAQELVDEIEFQYPLATIGAEYIAKFADIVTSIAQNLGVEMLLERKVVDRNLLITHCESLVSELMEEWGEEPGSKILYTLIEQNHGR